MFLNGFGVAHAIFIQAQEPFPILIKGFNGIITNDKFCLTRWGELQLSWWRRPLRLRNSLE